MKTPSNKQKAIRYVRARLPWVTCNYERKQGQELQATEFSLELGQCVHIDYCDIYQISVLLSVLLGFWEIFLTSQVSVLFLTNGANFNPQNQITAQIIQRLVV